tara:strand:- start:241 stop:636 length:396 start_codon:yes stop_codon:yes gene_type:complete
MLSPVDIRGTQSSRLDIFEYPLPPPLDAYVYPKKLIVARYDCDAQCVNTLSGDDFARLCNELVASSQCSDEVETVYDVPAIPINYEPEEEDADYASDTDDDDGHNDSNDDAEAETDDDNEWDDDDDVRSTA